MLDKNGHEIKVGDDVWFDFYDVGLSLKVVPAKIMEIQPTEIKIMFRLKQWRWVQNTQLEYATKEKLFLYKLEQD
jgi:hypothetical protein